MGGGSVNSHEAKHRMQVMAWKERVVACRGSGLSVKDWCEQKGYSRKTYYRWEREVLGLVSEEMTKQETALQIQPNSMTPVFEEMPVPVPQIQADTPQVIASVRIGRSSVEVYQGASADIVAAIFKGLGHAK